MNPLSTTLLTLLGTLVIVALTAVVNNSRLSDLRSVMESNHANTRSAIQDLRETINARFDAVDARFGEQKAELLRVEQVMDARLKHLEDHLR